MSCWVHFRRTVGHRAQQFSPARPSCPAGHSAPLMGRPLSYAHVHHRATEGDCTTHETALLAEHAYPRNLFLKLHKNKSMHIPGIHYSGNPLQGCIAWVLLYRYIRALVLQGTRRRYFGPRGGMRVHLHALVLLGPTGWLPTTFDPCSGLSRRTPAVYQKPPSRGGEYTSFPGEKLGSKRTHS